MGILSNIIFHKEFGYCLTCEVFIGTNTKEALTHVVGRKHRKNIRQLFRTYVADPFCNCHDAMYSHVIRDVKLDMSKLLTSCQEKNFIYDRENSLICFVCKETVSSSTDGKQIKKDLVDHLRARTEAHFQIMKDTATWIYNLPNCNGYISINKASVECSICGIDVDFEDDLRLHAAVGHLHTRLHKTNTQKNVTQDAVVLDVTRAGGSEGFGISAPPRNDPVPSPSVQLPPRNPVNTNKNEYDSIKRLLANPMFAPHVQFLEFRGNDFMCVLCNVLLTISSSGSFNLEEHIVGSNHRKEAEKRKIPTPDCVLTLRRELERTCPQDQIDKLLLDSVCAPHVKYLQIRGHQCLCLLCDIALTVSIKLNDNLKQHIQGERHQKKFQQRLVNGF